MSSTPSLRRPVTLRRRPNRFLAGSSRPSSPPVPSRSRSRAQDLDRHGGAATRPAGPINFGDPPVVKGARGGKTNAVTFPLFGDPTVRKGAGGQR